MPNLAKDAAERWRNLDQIEPLFEFGGYPAIAAELPCGLRDSASLMRCRYARRIRLVPELHLDKDDPSAAPRYQVNLAGSAPPTPGQDPVAGQREIDKGDEFGCPSAGVGAPPRVRSAVRVTHDPPGLQPRFSAWVFSIGRHHQSSPSILRAAR